MGRASSSKDLLRRRKRLLGPNTPLFYERPVQIVRGNGVWLYDETGRRYLDGYNNVPHVGHCHPRVVEAIARQSATLNVHSRYLHENVLNYAERLTATFDKKLSTLLLTCTGSEANDVALRMAHAVTGKRGLIGTDFTYHGNTTAVFQLSTLAEPFEGYGPHVRAIPAPDVYRPIDGLSGKALTDAYMRHLDTAIEELEAAGIGLSALVVCPIFANEGFPDLPPGLMRRMEKRVRQAGGLIVVDEVQAGFGRSGPHMWGHQHSGLKPDIVTLGKPMANGYPVGGVVTSPSIMATFRKKSMYFNTFGANPVGCAAALAVLDVMEDEGLMASAEAAGSYCRDRLRELAEKHSIIGDVRGCGLFFGTELVRDRKTKAPAAKEARRALNAMRDNCILIGLTGRHDNLLKIRPPMPFGTEQADLLVDTLDDVLRRL